MQADTNPSSSSFGQGLAEPFAVLELYTSEGCSSCPPADEALAAITERAEQGGLRVYTLELHVDYWNDLGWADPFSSHVYAERQQAYAAKLGLSEIFTPQLIVNGREQLVGSRRAEMDAAVERALGRRASVRVDGAAHVGSPTGEIQVDYSVLGCPGSCELTVALLQDHAETSVLRGENGSRKLRHRHIVRSLSTRALGGDGAGTIVARWADVATRPALVVAFVSDSASGAVLGVHSVPLEQR